jgi:hypothetical protein
MTLEKKASQRNAAITIALLAHPIEGTLAGLNSRFYLDRHAR